MKIHSEQFGTQAIRYWVDEIPSAELSRDLARFAQQIAEQDNVLDVAIGYNEVVATMNMEAGTDSNSKLTDIDQLLNFSDTNNDALSDPTSTSTHSITVHYNGEDLEQIASQCQLTTDEVISLHSNAEYTVAMIGFKPHFPFLHGLHPKLNLPRRASPRTQVKAGAVAIAAGQAGIYPCNTPGGWHILGYCDPELCKSIHAGDTVRFVQT